MNTEWTCLDALGQQWARDVFVDGRVKVREIMFLEQKWFELSIGTETIHVFPSRVLSPLRDAVQTMMTIVEEDRR
jgi:hypothetical protein